MFDSVSEYRLWDNAKKRFYKEKIEVFIKTVHAVSQIYNLNLSLIHI